MSARRCRCRRLVKTHLDVSPSRWNNSILLSNSLEKLCGLDGKGMCQFDDVDEAYVPLPTLDSTDIIPV